MHRPKFVRGLQRKLKKSISFLLAFLFAFSSIAPAFAAENVAPAGSGAQSQSASEGNNAVSGAEQVNSVQNTDSAGQTDNTALGTDSAKDSGNTIELASPGTKDKTKDPKKKDEDGTTGDIQAQSLSAPSIAGNSSDSSNSKDKMNLPVSDSVSGALNYDYPIIVPPGRNGLQPDLKLQYNSQGGEEGSIFGYGWSVNIPYIQRMNKTGSDKMYTDNYFVSSLSGELVSLGGTSYGSKIDNG